jgi:hypothetical protein
MYGLQIRKRSIAYIAQNVYAAAAPRRRGRIESSFNPSVVNMPIPRGVASIQASYLQRLSASTCVRRITRNARPRRYAKRCGRGNAPLLALPH